MTNQTRREVLLDLSEDLKDWMEDPRLGFTASQYARLLRRIKWNADQTPVPPKETKPPARAHVKGGVREPDHGGGCWTLETESQPEPKQPAPDHAPDCRQPHALSESCTEANVPSRALSPRQALGEALACVERAKYLVMDAKWDLTHAPHAMLEGSIEATHDVNRAVRSLRDAYEAAK